ncbi:MAG: class I SAM-dependent methyltransferase [Sandaracinaceae bacterium]|nr:class I SAM-dependent methyltransferase [Sandaracinaceae bacterium]
MPRPAHDVPAHDVPAHDVPAHDVPAHNVDAATVAGFGDEWSRFDFSTHSPEEIGRVFEGYFRIFPWQSLPPSARGFDAGSGTGRWARLVAPRVGALHCVDASEDALAVCKRNLAGLDNVRFHHASVGALPFDDASMDFGYSLGVLHHVPDTEAALRECVRVLKVGAPFLLYLYYALDNRPWPFRALWRASDLVRAGVSRLPMPARYAVSQALAAGVYWPLARSSRLLERVGLDVGSVPLSAYRDRTFYAMRTDALDRFGTRLEKRYTRAEMDRMMRGAGLRDVSFSDAIPFWTAVGYRER